MHIIPKLIKISRPERLPYYLIYLCHSVNVPVPKLAQTVWQPFRPTNFLLCSNPLLQNIMYLKTCVDKLILSKTPLMLIAHHLRFDYFDPSFDSSPYTLFAFHDIAG
eukprot:sb/3477671/